MVSRTLDRNARFGTADSRLLIHFCATLALLAWDATLRRRVQYDHAGRHIDTETHTLPAGFDLALPLRHGQWLLGTMSLRITPALVNLGEQSARFVEAQGAAIRRSTDQVAAIQRPGESVLDTIFRYDHGFIFTVLAGGGAGLLPLTRGPGGAWAVSGDSLIALVNTMEAHVRFVRVEQHGTRLVRSGLPPI